VVDEGAAFAVRTLIDANLWRRAAAHLQSNIKRMLAERCDLWLFPGQHYFSYIMPKPTVAVVHDLMHIHEPTFPEVSQTGLTRRRNRHYRAMCRHADIVLVDSNVGRSHVLDAFPEASGKVEVLPYAVPDYINTDVGPPPERGTRWPARFLFYPAQLWQHKNHVRLIRAFAMVSERHRDLHLVLCGSPKNAQREITVAIEQCGVASRVLLCGYVDNEQLVDLYRNATALVMPTFFGPTNIPPLEAMALSCPVIVSDVYGMREQLGDAAIYVDPTSTESIANAITALLENDQLRRTLVSRGHSVAAAHSQAAFARKFGEIIERWRARQ
jgi:glycosyltransferase involved in cell wall biosynthesis